MRSGRFRPTDRIRRSREYGLLARRGRRKAARGFVMVVGNARLGRKTSVPVEAAAGPRLGITVSRRVGNAVERNRIKRCVREWFRGARAAWRRDADVVVIARRGAAALSGEQIRRELDALCEAMGVSEA